MSSHYPMSRLMQLAHRTLFCFFLGLMVFLFIGQTDSLAAVTLKASWKPSPDSRVVGYKLHYGTTSRNYSSAVNASNQTTCSVPDLQEAQTYYFAASAYDASGNASSLSSEIAFTIPTAAKNTAPVASNGTLLVTEDTGASGTLRATDADGNNLTFTIVTQPSRGAVKVDNASSGAFTYTPNRDVTGSDSFSFRANDGNLDSNTATVSVTIVPVNDPPVAVADTARTPQNTTVSISVLANDSDPDGDTLSLVSATRGTNGTTALSGTVVRYTPFSGFIGTDSFTYTITDGHGAGATGTVTVYVDPVNSIPKADEEDSGLLPRDGWTLKYVDSQELIAQNGAAENAFDNDPNTFWHTEWYRSSPKHPHEIQIDLGGVYEIEGFRYLPRQDNQVNGRIKQYEFYISSDGVNWGTPVVTGVFANNASEKQVSFERTVGSCIRLRALGEVNGRAWSSMAEIRLLGKVHQGPSLLPRDGWTLKYVDSQELIAQNGAAENAFDNDPNTFWHTEWYRSSPKHPHEIQIDLGGVYEIEGFRYLPRQDNQVNGRIKQYEFYISSDGVNWGTPVVTGVFANNASEKQVSFERTVGSCIRLRALGEVNGRAWSSMAEIRLLGR